MRKPRLCSILIMLIAAVMLPACTTPRYSRVQTRESQAAITPASALEMLREGNHRFYTDHSLRRDLVAQQRATKHGQYPFAAVTSCMDSRTSTELIFDQGIGDIFNVRVAGNVINEDNLGSLEYAAKVTGVKLIVVLGHSHCGAVKGAADDVKLGNLTALLAKIKPAAKDVPDSIQPRNSKNEQFVAMLAAANVQLAVRQISERSPVLKEMIDKGQINVIGGNYDLDTGRVEFYEYK